MSTGYITMLIKHLIAFVIVLRVYWNSLRYIWKTRM